VIHGSAFGPSSADDRYWGQDSAGIVGIGNTNDRFGAALAITDWNADGYEDLAVGAPGESGDAVSGTACGAVHVIYGSSTGLSATGDIQWHQNTVGLEDSCEAGDDFAAVLR
jgi:hypothetical protein